jgi:hypothetical protein
MRAGHLQQTFARVAVAADALVGMTARAQARIDARFETMPRQKSGAVEIGASRFIEPQRRRERRHVHRVALRAFALGVTARAKVARRGRSQTVTLEKVFPMHDVALRARALRLESNVAR